VPSQVLDVAERKDASEEANSGTIFLDEIGDMPLDLQPICSEYLRKEPHLVSVNKSSAA